MHDRESPRDVDATIQALFEISSVVNSKENLDELYAAIHASLNKILQMENFAIAIYHEEKDSMTFPYFVDELDNELGEIFEISKKQSLTARVIHAGRPLIFYEDDIRKMPDRAGRIAFHSQCKVWAGAPLKIRGKSFGAILVQSYRSEDAFNEKDLVLLNSVAEFIAVSIERKQAQVARFQTEQINVVMREVASAVHKAENLKQLYEHIHHSLGRLMNISNFFIALYDSRTQTVSFDYFVDRFDKAMPRTENLIEPNSLTGEVILRKRPLLLTETMLFDRAKKNKIVGTVPKIWLGVPLMIKGEVIGVAAAQSYEDANLYTKKDLSILTAVSNQIAIAIHRRRAEDALKESEARYRLLTDSLSDVVWTRDMEMNLTYISPSVEAQTGFSVQEKMNMPLDQSMPPESLTKTMKVMEEEIRLERRGRTAPDKFRVIQVDSFRKDGSIYPMETVVSFIRDETGKAIAIAGINRDITERKKIETQLRLRDEKLSQLSSQTEQFSMAAASMISLKDAKEVFHKISRAIVEYSDFKRVIISLFKDKFPFREIIAFGGVDQATIERLRKVEMSKKWYDKVFIKENNIGQFSYYIPHTQKGILHPVTVYGKGPPPESKDRWHPEDNLFVRMNDEEGRPIGVISVDESKSGLQPNAETVRPLEIFSSLISQILILKREQEQRQKMETQLRQTQKMEAIGTLAGGIAHDFNNILSGVLGYAELIQEDLNAMDCRPVTRDRMARIIKASLRAKDLIGQILDFSRAKSRDPVSISVILIIKEVLQLLRASLPSSITIEQNLDSQGCVMADPTGIYQVVMNLCTNARDAMQEDGGILSLRLQDVVLDEKDIAGYEGVAPGEFIMIAVKDTGHGMEKEVLDRILEPFYTTKTEGKGTGMGLSVVHGIVKSLNGLMKISSASGRGSTFELFLPVHEPVCQPDHQMLDQIKSCEGNEKILVVDDEDTLAGMLRDSLEYFGYQTVFFSESKKALAHFRKEPDEYDLIISDITMPELTGDTLVKHARQVRPDIPVILCTGFNDALDQKKMDQMKINALLYKPVPARHLVSTVRTVLDGGTHGQYSDY
ncbi:GAF domain-containing protein [Desulfospira joergensenii]|uniref:GAF domain-containing protein n=1 Tax=Desulfospira joergensenii TaxID=53329 RepID=UPI0003B4C28E|nr:GAF domain-containing protein [Desulfospira joergensenii]